MKLEVQEAVLFQGQVEYHDLEGEAALYLVKQGCLG